MKKIIVLSAILFTFGCGVKKGTTVTKTKTTTVETGEKFIPWKHPKDDKSPELPTSEILTLQFKVSEQVKIDEEEYHSITHVKKGLRYDSSWITNNLKYVDINELGRARTVVKSNGKVVGVYVTFDEKEQDVHELYFKKNPSDGYFYLTTIDGKKEKSRFDIVRRIYSTTGCKLLCGSVSHETRTIKKSHAKGATVEDYERKTKR